MKRRNFLFSLLALPFASKVPNPAIGSKRANELGMRLAKLDEHIKLKLGEHLREISWSEDIDDPYFRVGFAFDRDSATTDQNREALHRVARLLNAPTGFKK